MKLKKCPRCELNYILDGGDLCSVCQEEVHGGKWGTEESTALCSVCGEETAVVGQDMCADCLREFQSIAGAETNSTEDETNDEVVAVGIENDAMSSLDEIETLDDDVDASYDGEDDETDEDSLEEEVLVNRLIGAK